MSLVNQVVGVQGQGEQRHRKDLKFSCRSFMNIDKVATQFSLCHLLTLYVLHDQMLITCHIIKLTSKNCVSLQDIFKGERNRVSFAVDRIPQTIDLPRYVTI